MSWFRILFGGREYQGEFFEVNIFTFFHPCFSGVSICIENFARISLFEVLTISTVILKHWLNFIFIAECSSWMFLHCAQMLVFLFSLMI